MGRLYGLPSRGSSQQSFLTKSSSRFYKICNMYSTFVIILLLGLSEISVTHGERVLNASETEINILVDQTKLFQIIQYGNFSEGVTVTAVITHPDRLQIIPNSFNASISDGSVSHDLCALGKNPGKTDVEFNVTPTGYVNTDALFLRVTVMQSHEIYVISVIMGWIYMLAWSVSFYPQIWTNFKRKSVVGLNFDFVSLNILGFFLYSVHNCGMYYSPEIQAEYFKQYPRGMIPVHANDVFFSLHAFLATAITIVQCFMYEREGQRISILGRSLLSVFLLVVLVSLILASVKVILWLQFTHICGYVKLSITFIKYVPQAYMNYKRKSTIGWSIGNIFLDFTGGSLSILQMLLDAYNYDDWYSIFGDVTKFGLGMFSLIFDMFFMMQHYVLYRNKETMKIDLNTKM